MTRLPRKDDPRWAWVLVLILGLVIWAKWAVHKDTVTMSLETQLVQPLVLKANVRNTDVYYLLEMQHINRLKQTSSI